MEDKYAPNDYRFKYFGLPINYNIPKVVKRILDNSVLSRGVAEALELSDVSVSFDIDGFRVTSDGDEIIHPNVNLDGRLISSGLLKGITGKKARNATTTTLVLFQPVARQILNLIAIEAKKYSLAPDIAVIDEFLISIGDEPIGTPNVFESNDYAESPTLAAHASRVFVALSKDGDTEWSINNKDGFGFPDIAIAACAGLSDHSFPAHFIYDRSLLPLAFKCVETRIGSKLFHYIINGTKKEKILAANAIFSISSVFNNSILIDFIKLYSQDEYETHFSSLYTAKNPENLSIFKGDSETARHYIEVAGFSYLLSCYLPLAEKLVHGTLIHNFPELNVNEVLLFSGNIIQSIDMLNQSILSFKNLSDANINNEILEKISSVKQLIGNFLEYEVNTENLTKEVNDIERIFSQIIEFEDIEMPSKVLAKTEIFDWFSALERLLKTSFEDLKEDMLSLISLHPANTISALQDRLEKTRQAITNTEARFSSIVGNDKDKNKLLQFIETLKELSNENKDLELEEENYTDYDELLSSVEHENTELKSENARLGKELLQAKSAIDSLENALSYKASDKKDTLEPSVLKSITQAIEGSSKLTPVSVLDVVATLRPKAVILPSAYESAKESGHFMKGDRMLDMLLKLTGEYVDMVISGTPDSEARKVFGSYALAANDNLTMSSPSARKEREYIYRGEKHLFEQHLRIGNAKDERLTMRIYFKIIDGMMVIAHCGAHKTAFASA